MLDGMDPRINVIDKRLKDIKRIIAVSGGKGGIGKSSTASLLALSLADIGKNVGLIDLDFYGPSCHVILGIRDVYPEEEKGVIPPDVDGISFMSIIYYAKDNPLTARGIDISNAIIELFAITQWGKLDYLIIDMPPGIGDSTLDIIRLVPKIEFLVITNQSKVVLETVKKTLKMLKDSKVPILGVIQNMKTKEFPEVREWIEKFDVRYLGEIAYDDGFEDCLGVPERLLKSAFAKRIRKIINISSSFETWRSYG